MMTLYLILLVEGGVELQKQMNIAEFNNLDEATRGDRWVYLRLEVHDVLFEVVEYFDLYHHILVGGIDIG